MRTNDLTSKASSAAVSSVDAQLLRAIESAARAIEGRPTPTTADELRDAFVRMRRSIERDAPDLRAVVELEVPIGAASIPARLYEPSGLADLIIVYFHGGGWVLGDLDTGDAIARHLCVAAEATVLSVEYRKAPEHPFPAAVHDALAGVDFAATHLATGRPLAVAGDSAGATLATVCALHRSAKLRGPVKAQLLAYPATDCDLTRPSYLAEPHGPAFAALVGWCWDQYVPVPADRLHPDATPLHTGDLSAAPAAVILLAGHDGVHDEGQAYAWRLAAAGVDVDVLRYDTALHDFLAYVGSVDLSDAAMRAGALALRAATLESL